MISIKRKEDCCGCEACLQICPIKCIKYIYDHEGFLYPVIEEKKCVDCGECEKTCPIINKNDKKIPLAVLAVKNKNKDIQKNSSSGGYFSILAEDIIDKGGVVFGAKYNKAFEVVHDYTENKNGIEAFRGSKYVQSRINESYANVKKFLKDDRYVLFSGTPCQIRGLNLYLKKDYEKLYLVDFICHGIPSPKVYKLYISSIQKILDGVMIAINMRDKTKGWIRFSFAVEYLKNGNIIKKQEVYNDNVYMKGFLRHLYLRPSCHECLVKAFSSNANLTMGDYWGIENIHPDFYEDDGVSLVYIHDEKIKISENKYDYIKSDLHTSVKINKYVYESAKPSKNRNKFFKELNKTPINKLISKYSNPGIYEIVYKMIYDVARKMHIIKIIKKIL